MKQSRRDFIKASAATATAAAAGASLGLPVAGPVQAADA